MHPKGSELLKSTALTELEDVSHQGSGRERTALYVSDELLHEYGELSTTWLWLDYGERVI